MLGSDGAIAKATRATGKPPRPRRSFWDSGFRFWGGAALVGAAAMLALILYLVSPTVYSTGVGQKLVVRLDDGSRITLNTSTRLAVLYSGGERLIRLDDGQALFEVAHDASRPFRVAAADTSVTAIGTEFEVRRDAHAVNVTLVEGRISVAAGGDGRTSRLAQTGATLASGPAGIRMGRTDARAALSWVDGRIDLRDVPLAAAVAEVNRYARASLVLDAQSLSQTKVSGNFATGDRDAFAAAVTALLPLRETRDEDGTIHLRSADGR